MDHFESIVATLLEAEHFWVRRSYKVNLTKEQKQATGKHSIPRPEIDLLAFHPGRNEVIAFEAKSYLDSPGVRLEELQQQHDIATGLYKLFTTEKYRKIVLGALKKQLIKEGMAISTTTVTLGLVAGKVYRKRSNEVRAHLEKKGWVFWSPEDIKSKVEALADQGYENDPAIITAKILTR